MDSIQSDWNSTIRNWSCRVDHWSLEIYSEGDYENGNENSVSHLILGVKQVTFEWDLQIL